MEKRPTSWNTTFDVIAWIITAWNTAATTGTIKHRQLACVISKNDCEPHQIEEPDVRTCGRAAGSWCLSKALQVFEKTTQQSATVIVRPVTLVVKRQNLLQLVGAAPAEFYGQSHRANMFLNSAIETVSPPSTSAISSSMSGVTCSTPFTMRA